MPPPPHVQHRRRLAWLARATMPDRFVAEFTPGEHAALKIAGGYLRGGYDHPLMCPRQLGGLVIYSMKGKERGDTIVRVQTLAEAHAFAAWVIGDPRSLSTLLLLHCQRPQDADKVKRVKRAISFANRIQGALGRAGLYERAASQIGRVMTTIDDVRRRALAALRPPPRLRLSEWIERHVVLPDDATRCSGSREWQNLKLSNLPFRVSLKKAV